MESASLTPAKGSRVILLKHWNQLPPPLFIIGLPRSFTSLVCAMLGQHPQMYGVPETHLFPFETLGTRAERAAAETYPMAHGLLRAVAQLYFGAQTQDAVQKAQRWLAVRSDLTTDLVFKILADRVFPRALVEKSPSSTDRREVLERMHQRFPRARFLHLVRHPQGFGKSVMKYIQERRKRGPIPPSHWLLRISSYPPLNISQENSPENVQEGTPESAVLDPQNGWYFLHKIIAQFLNSVPPGQWMRVRGEELLAEPDRMLTEIAAWMGMRTDCEAIQRMKHPERSPYAFLGAPGARYGADAFFLQDPVLRPSRAKEPMSLEGPLEWRQDGAGFYPEVKLLAQEFGY